MTKAGITIEKLSDVRSLFDKEMKKAKGNKVKIAAMNESKIEFGITDDEFAEVFKGLYAKRCIELTEEEFKNYIASVEKQLLEKFLGKSGEINDQSEFTMQPPSLDSNDTPEKGRLS